MLCKVGNAKGMTIKGELTHCFTKNLIGIHFSVTKTPGPRINPPGTLYTKSLPFWCKKSDSHPNTPDENWRECEPKNTALGDDFPFQWGESSGSMLVSGNMPHNKAVTASLLHKITRFKVKKIMFQNIITFSGNICTSCFFNVEQNQKKTMENPQNPQFPKAQLASWRPKSLLTMNVNGVRFVGTRVG